MKQEKKRRNRRIATAIIIIICIICGIIGLTIYNSVIIPNRKYNKAIALLDSGDIVKAYEALIALNGYKDCDSIAYSIQNEYKIKTAEVGDRFVFGQYEQNNSKYSKENITWRVLEVDHNTNTALIISEYALDEQNFHTNQYTDTITWENCTLRRWLNSTFSSSAFSASEWERVQTTVITDDVSGNQTQDKIFLLSDNEAEKYFSSDYSRECSHSYKSITCSWYLRTPGRFVSVSGKISGEIEILFNKRYIRPAMWISLD